MKSYTRIGSNLYELHDRAYGERQTAAGDLFGRGCEAERVRPFTSSARTLALSLHREAIHCDPTHVGAWIHAGNLCFFMGDAVRARRYYRMAVAADPCSAVACFNFAIALEETGFFSDASVWYGKALTIHPRYADVHYNMGLLYFNVFGDLRKAAFHFRRFLECGDMRDPCREGARRMITYLAPQDLHVVRRPPTTTGKGGPEVITMIKG